MDATDLGDRVFQVFTNAQLTLSNLVITGGGVIGEPGGAIYNAGTLYIQFCTITANSSGNGGYSLVPENGADGGGIYNSGTLTMDNSVVSENTCGTGTDGYTGDGGNGGNGGGICNSGTMILRNCSISNNSSGQERLAVLRWVWLMSTLQARQVEQGDRSGHLQYWRHQFELLHRQRELHLKAK